MLAFHHLCMDRALQLACDARDAQEVPVGAVLVHRGNIVSENRNRMRQYAKPWAHAEMMLLQDISSQICTPYLYEYSIYVTLEPCVMCAAALALARIGAIYFGAYDTKRGGIDHGCRIFDGQQSFFKPPVIVSGMYQRKCQEILTSFFCEKRR